LPQSLVARLLIVAVALIASALLTAFVMEARDVARYISGQTFAVVVAGFLIVAVALVASALLTEFVLEARDVARYMPGQTFATIGGARIRYRLLGADRPGVTVVFLSGLNGSIEQADHFQRAMSSAVPSLAYDRAGYGFSGGSTAHTAEQQAKELAALLHTLKLEGSVVLVAYSVSSLLARVFADRFPEKTAGMYLIEPTMPEFSERMPQPQTPRRWLVRFIVHHLLGSSLGYIRLTQRMRSCQGPTSLVEQRAEAVLARRPHYWAQAQEWYALPESWRQTLDAQIPPALPPEVAFSKHTSEDETFKALAAMYAELVARSSRGKLVELEEELLFRRPAVVILNTGIAHRVGHHRMYVTMARELAALGHLAFRFDFSGIGPSASWGDGLSPIEAHQADLSEALDWLTASYDVKEVVLIGLCSGADIALSYGHSDKRVVGLVLLDPTPTVRFYAHYISRRLTPLRSWVVFRGRTWPDLSGTKRATEVGPGRHLSADQRQ
jgi:pimeloyl-ACP methyl ester carboxylesterase